MKRTNDTDRPLGELEERPPEPPRGQGVRPLVISLEQPPEVGREVRGHVHLQLPEEGRLHRREELPEHLCGGGGPVPYKHGTTRGEKKEGGQRYIDTRSHRGCETRSTATLRSNRQLSGRRYLVACFQRARYKRAPPPASRRLGLEVQMI